MAVASKTLGAHRPATTPWTLPSGVKEHGASSSTRLCCWATAKVDNANSCLCLLQTLSTPLVLNLIVTNFFFSFPTPLSVKFSCASGIQQNRGKIRRGMRWCTHGLCWGPAVRIPLVSFFYCLLFSACLALLHVWKERCGCEKRGSEIEMEREGKREIENHCIT